MATWPSKDPDAVFDYCYTIALDAGDSIEPGDFTFERLSGSVVIDVDPPTLAASPTTVDGVYGQVLSPIWLSGGVDGEISLFRVSWVTVGGRTDDDVIALSVIANEYVAPLNITDYSKPSPAHLITRYPAFADVNKATIAYWLTDAERYVDTSWMAGDYAAALMAMAAHSLSIAGHGTEASATADLPVGITSMRIGTLGLTFDGATTRNKATGDLQATRYGAEFAALRRRNKAGPRVAGAGVIDFSNYPYPMGAW